MFKKKISSTLVYFLSETHFFSQDYSVLVVNLVGSINHQTASILKECEHEISKLKSKWIILNFRDVASSPEPSVFEILDQLQQAIRIKPVLLKFTGLHPELKETLISSNIVNEEDVFNNLAEALQQIGHLQASKSAAA